LKDFTRLATLEFSRDRKSMSILVKEAGARKNVMFIKGAPDYLLERTNLIMNT
jgi:magnesium-transporting ATPase (P-type)